MKNKGVINQLKTVDDSDSVKVTLVMLKHGLKECCSHIGEWRNKEFSCDSITTWRLGELFTDSMTIKDLIELFESKNMHELKDSDFIELNLVESIDGATSVKNIVWSEPLTEMEKDALDVMDLYFDSEMTNCEFKFDSDSIESIKIEAGDNLVINL